MPIFEYRCKQCGEKFETLVFSSQCDSVECEKCGSKETEKIMSAFASVGSKSSSGCCDSNTGFT